MIIDGVNIVDKLSKYRNNKIIVLGHEHPDVDSIISGYLLEKVLISNGYNACFCITDKSISKETSDILKGYDFDPSKYQRDIKGEDLKFVLVDHSERNIDGDILLVIDHHPTSKKYDVNLYFNKSISSTTLYLCKENENILDKKDIELAILAAMLDTASFNSTKAREEDKIWVINKCKELNIDYDRLYESGLYFTPLSDLKESSLNGLKKYDYNGKKVEASYVHINNDKSNDRKINEIVNILKQYVKENNLDMFVFIVHNMGVLKTKVFKIYRNHVEEVQYDKYTSRGNDIMPSVEREINKGR